MCADRSSHRSNAKYWADQTGGRCYQDSVNPTQDLSAKLYDSIEDCCTIGLSWLSPAQCLSASGVDVSSGSNSFYIRDDHCVQDCVGDAPCGGLAEKWDTKYENQDECCDELSWVARRDCILGRRE